MRYAGSQERAMGSQEWDEEEALSVSHADSLCT